MPFGGLLSAGISAGGNLLGGLFGSKGASKAAQQLSQTAQNVGKSISTAATNAQGAVNTANTTGQGQIAGGVTGANQQLSDAISRVLGIYSPFTSTAPGAINSLQQLAGTNGPLTQQFSFNPSDLQNDPGYQFTRQQGIDAIQRSAAAQGALNSTGTLKSLANYTTGAANQYFGDAYQRALNTFQANRQGVLSRINTLQGLAGLSGAATQGAAGTLAGLTGQGAGYTYGGGLAGSNLGLTAAQLAGNYGLQGAEATGNVLMQGAGAQAAGTMGATNAWNNALAGGTNSILGFLNRPSFGMSTPDMISNSANPNLYDLSSVLTPAGTTAY